MYESAYNKMFWGMIFIVFNINIGSINIMPNFIGYILLMSGLSVLAEQHKIFQKGRIPAGVLIIITLKDIVSFGTIDLLKGGIQMDNLLLTALGVVETLLNLYVIFIICKGIYLLAQDRGLTQLMDIAKGRFYFYFTMGVIILFFTPFSINLSRNINILMIIAALINTICALFIAGLFRMSKVQLGSGMADEV